LQAALAVGLLERAASAGGLGVVEGLVLGQSARQDVIDRRIDGQFEAGQLPEDVVEADDVRAMGEVAVDGYGRPPLGEAADLGGVVEGLDVAAGAGDGDAVEQLEEVEVQRAEDGLGRALLGGQPCPVVEGALGAV
jgi:hypothetical protein